MIVAREGEGCRTLPDDLLLFLLLPSSFDVALRLAGMVVAESGEFFFLLSAVTEVEDLG